MWPRLVMSLFCLYSQQKHLKLVTQNVKLAPIEQMEFLEGGQGLQTRGMEPINTNGNPNRARNTRF